MARFLSEAWFEAVMTNADCVGYAEETDEVGESSLGLQQVVTGTPDGEVHYGVRLAGGHATVVPGLVKDPDVTFTEDYPTAVAIARGELSAQAGLLAGRIRVSGNLATLASGPAATIDDPIPPAVRAATTY